MCCNVNAVHILVLPQLHSSSVAYFTVPKFTVSVISHLLCSRLTLFPIPWPHFSPFPISTDLLFVCLFDLLKWQKSVQNSETRRHVERGPAACWYLLTCFWACPLWFDQLIEPFGHGIEYNWLLLIMMDTRSSLSLTHISANVDLWIMFPVMLQWILWVKKIYCWHWNVIQRMVLSSS